MKTIKKYWYHVIFYGILILIYMGYKHLTSQVFIYFLLWYIITIEFDDYISRLYHNYALRVKTGTKLFDYYGFYFVRNSDNKISGFLYAKESGNTYSLFYVTLSNEAECIVNSDFKKVSIICYPDIEDMKTYKYADADITKWIDLKRYYRVFIGTELTVNKNYKKLFEKIKTKLAINDYAADCATKRNFINN